MSRAISPASVATRRTLSPMEPSLAWNVTASRAGEARRQRLLAILAPEERRIRQARAHHAFIAGAHLGGLAALDVAHGDEVRAAACRPAVLHREIPLVMLQRGDQHFARQIEETRFETARERARPFHQRGDFIEQCLVEQRLAAERLAAAAITCSRISARRAAKSAITLPALAQRGFVIRRLAPAANRRGAMNRWPRVALPASVSSMRAGMTSAPYSSTSQCTGRTNSARTMRPSACASGMGSASSERCTMAGQQARGSLPGLAAFEVQEFALALGDARERGRRRRRISRRTWCAAVVGLPSLSKAALTGGPLSLMALRRLRGGEIAHQHGQAARCGERTQLTMRQRGFGQACAQCRRRKPLQFRQCQRRQLLGAELDEKIARAALFMPGSTRLAASIGKPSASRLS